MKFHFKTKYSFLGYMKNIINKTVTQLKIDKEHKEKYPQSIYICRNRNGLCM